MRSAPSGPRRARSARPSGDARALVATVLSGLSLVAVAPLALAATTSAILTPAGTASDPVIDMIRAAYAEPPVFTLTIETPAAFSGTIPHETQKKLDTLGPTVDRTDRFGRKGYVITRDTLFFDGVETVRIERENLLAGGPADRRTDVELQSPSMIARAPQAPTRNATVTLYPRLSPDEQANVRAQGREPQARLVAQTTPIHLALYVRDTLTRATDLVVAAGTTPESTTLTSAGLGLTVEVGTKDGAIRSATFHDTPLVVIKAEGALPSIALPAPHPERWLIWAGPDAIERSAAGRPFDSEEIYSNPRLLTPTSAPEKAAIAAKFDWKSLAAAAQVTTDPNEVTQWRQGQPWPPASPEAPRK